jgi:hypothetical protein
MFMGIPSVNRGKITSIDSTHPTSQIAKQIPAQRNARNVRPIAERFSAWAQSGLAAEQRSNFDEYASFWGILVASDGDSQPIAVLDVWRSMRWTIDRLGGQRSFSAPANWAGR